MSQNTSETPRADKLTIKHGRSPMPDRMRYSEMKLLARQLERELNEANKGVERLQIKLVNRNSWARDVQQAAETVKQKLEIAVKALEIVANSAHIESMSADVAKTAIEQINGVK